MSALVITCPDCGTRYRTDPASIGDNGRTVRCARCKETWFVPSPDLMVGGGDAVDPAVVDPDAIALDEAMSEPGNARIVPPSPVGPATAVPEMAAASTAMDRATGFKDKTRSAAAPLQTLPRKAGPTADVLLRDQADAAKLARRRRAIRWIWIVALLLALAAIVTAYLNRQAIVNRQPKAATLYQAVGMEVREDGLEIDPPIAKTALVEGRPVIRIEGAVRNLSGKPVDLPLIELTLHNTAGEELAQWYVEPSQAQLPGDGRLPFSTEYADPPADVTGLRYRFASR